MDILKIIGVLIIVAIIAGIIYAINKYSDDNYDFKVLGVGYWICSSIFIAGIYGIATTIKPNQDILKIDYINFFSNLWHYHDNLLILFIISTLIFIGYFILSFYLTNFWLPLLQIIFLPLTFLGLIILFLICFVSLLMSAIFSIGDNKRY